MAEFDLNLSTRPFPAYRATSLALAAALVLWIAVSIWLAAGFTRYSSMANDIRASERDLRVEAESLARRVAELESRLDRPESAAKLNEIAFINSLIMRKDFSWTRMFAHFEDMVPDSVHLISLRPEFLPEGGVAIALHARGRSIADVTDLISRMEQSPVFADLKVDYEEKANAGSAADVDVTMTVNYHPEKDVQ